MSRKTFEEIIHGVVQRSHVLSAKIVKHPTSKFGFIIYADGTKYFIGHHKESFVVAWERLTNPIPTIREFSNPVDALSDFKIAFKYHNFLHNKKV
jgi:hypothetical protein